MSMKTDIELSTGGEQCVQGHCANLDRMWQNCASLKIWRRRKPSMKPDLSRLLLLALVGGTPIFAQFQAPTPDELKMTADPKYPDASAVYLNYEKKTDNDVGYESVYARIKLLNESAKELATVTIEYPKSTAFDGIAAIQGRTIHPDGSI